MGFMLNQAIRFSYLWIVILVFLIYAPALDGEFIWDDDAHVLHIEKMKSFNGLKDIWFEPGATLEYYPLLFTTFWIERHLFGDDPWGYHAVNIGLHASNAILLQRILIRLTVPGAFWAATIFALHPVHVESVAWITERKNCLSTFFYFLSLMAYLRFAGIGGQEFQVSSKTRKRNYFHSFFFFLAALLSKTTTCTLPATMILLVGWRTQELNWKKILPTLPFFILGISAAFMTYWVETQHVGAKGPDWELQGVERFLIAGKALWFYFWKLIWPQPLIFIYPRWKLDPTDISLFLFPISFLLLIYVLWRNRGKWGYGFLIGTLFFAGTLTPALGFLDFYWMRFSFVADHLQYPSSAGVIAIVAGLIAWYEKKRWSMLKLVFPIVLILLGVLTHRQIPIYQNKKALWNDTIRKNPQAWLAHENLGFHLFENGETKKAITHLKTAVRLKPDSELVHLNLGVVLKESGHQDEAMNHYRIAIQIKPDFALAHYNLGAALKIRGDLEQAIFHYKKAIEINPRDPYVHNNLGSVYQEKGDLLKAMTYYKKALNINPNFGKAQYNIGLIYDLGLGVKPDKKEAIKWYLLAANEGLAEAQFNLGTFYHGGYGVVRDFGQARKWWLLSAGQGYSEAQYNLSLIYAKGHGVVQDYIQASKWMKIAEAHGNQNGTNHLILIEKLMKKVQVEKAERLARQWIREHERK